MSPLPGSNRRPFGYKPNALPLSQGGKLEPLLTIPFVHKSHRAVRHSILDSAFRSPGEREVVLICVLLRRKQGGEEGKEKRNMQRLHARPMLTSGVSRASEIRGAQ